MSDLVVHEIRDRGPHAPVEAEGMKCRGKLQLYALRPYRIVVVFAVEAEIVHPRQIGCEMWGLARECWNWPAHERCHHHDFEAEPCRMFELFNRLPRRMHRDASCGSHPGEIFVKNVSVIIVEGAADRAAELIVLDMCGEQTLARI